MNYFNYFPPIPQQPEFTNFAGESDNPLKILGALDDTMFPYNAYLDPNCGNFL